MPALQGRTAELWACKLESMGDEQEKMFIGYSADKLEANGQTSGSKAARDGDGGDSGEIGGAVHTQEQGTSRMVGIVDSSGFFVDQWRGDGRRWNDESVDVSIGHREMELLDELVPQFESLQIVRR